MLFVSAAVIQAMMSTGVDIQLESAVLCAVVKGFVQ